MNFETLKKHLKEGEVIITFQSMTSEKVFTKTCTLQDVKINQKEELTLEDEQAILDVVTEYMNNRRK